MHESVNPAEEAPERKQVHLRFRFKVTDLELGDPRLGEGDLAGHPAVYFPARDGHELAVLGEVVRALVKVRGGYEVVHCLVLSEENCSLTGRVFRGIFDLSKRFSSLVFLKALFKTALPNWYKQGFCFYSLSNGEGKIRFSRNRVKYIFSHYVLQIVHYL